MKQSVLWLLMVVISSTIALRAQTQCKHCADVRMYFRTEEPTQVNGSLTVRLYCIAEEAGRFYLPQFSTDWNVSIQPTQNYPESVSMLIGDSLALDYAIQYDTTALPYYAVNIQASAAFDAPYETYTLSHTLYLYFTPYHSVEIMDQADYFTQRRVWLVGDEATAPSRVFIPKDSIPVSDIPIGFEPDTHDIVYDYIDVEGLGYAIPMLYKDFEGYNPTNGVVVEGRANTFRGEINHLRIFAMDTDDKGQPKEINLKGARVEIWRDRAIGDQHIGTFFTDDEGFVADNGNRIIHFSCTATWTGTIKVYLKIKMKNADESIRVRKKWDINDANVVKTANQSLAHSNNFIPLNFANQGNGLSLHENELGNVLTWIAWAKQVTNQALIATGASIHDNLLVTVKFDNNTVSNCQYDLLALRLDNECFNKEQTVIHEFGHFVDDQIQNRISWIWGGGIHRTELNNKNTQQTMSEGFATGYAHIIDEMTYNVDTEAGGVDDKAHERWFYSKIPTPLRPNGNPHLHHPFLSEIILARTMLDMWDGPNNYQTFTPNRIVDTLVYNDLGQDHFEMSFAEIMLPFIQHGIGIKDMSWYFHHLLTGDCERDRALKELWYYNFSDTDAPLEDIMVLNTDEIHAIKKFSFARFTNPNQLPIVDSVLWNKYIAGIDVSILSDDINSYNLSKYDVMIWDTTGGAHDSIKFMSHNFSPIVLSDDITIQNNAKLTIHADAKPRFSNQPDASMWVIKHYGDTTDIYFGPVLWEYTFFSDDLEVQLCANRTCTVQNDGLLEVGSDSPVRVATMVIKEGSTLHLKNNGKLVIHDNSKLVIEEGANFIFESGAQIELLGNDAILEIRGNWQITDNAIFTFTGSGFVRTLLPSIGGNNLTVGNNCELRFEGTNPNDKVLEIADNSYISNYALSQTTLQNGKCVLGENAFWDTGNGQVLFENAIFTALDPERPYQSIYTNGQAPMIHDCVFSYGERGITARNFGSLGAGIGLSNVEIHHCKVALQSYDKGGDLYNVNFHDNVTGWKQDYAIFNSNWTSSQAYNNEFAGVWYEGNTRLNMKSPQLSYNQYGVVMQGTGTLQGTCGYSRSNYSAGIALTDNATLDLAESGGMNPKMDLGDYTIGIFTWGGDYMYLKNGYNNVSPKPHASSLAIAGYINTPNSPLIFRHNHWNEVNPLGQVPNPGTSPLQGQDYITLHTSTGNPILISDVSPIAFESCNSISTEKLPYVEACIGCELIYTPSFDGIRIDSALQSLSSQIYVANSEAAINILSTQLSEIIAYNYSEISTKEQEVLDAAWRMLKSVFVEGVKYGYITVTNGAEWSVAGAKVAASLQKRISQNPAKTFALLTDKISLYLLANQPEVAMSILSQMQPIDDREVELKAYWRCFIEVRKDIKNGDLSYTALQNRLSACPSLSVPIWGNNENKWNMDTFNNFSMELYPNPTPHQLNIQLGLPHEMNATIEMYDISGKNVFLIEDAHFGKGFTSFLLPLPSLPSGLYNLVFRTEYSAKTQKVVIE